METRSTLKLLNSNLAEEHFRIIKRLPNVVISKQEYERMVAIRLKKHQPVCILKPLSSSPTYLDSFGEENYFKRRLKSPLVMLLPTQSYGYRGADDEKSVYAVFNCVLRERLTDLKTLVSDGLILQIIYQYLRMMQQLDEFFKKPNHMRVCNRPEVTVERFDRKSKRIDLIFGSTDVSSNYHEEDSSDKLKEISESICTGRNEFEKEMLFEIVEFITQEHVKKDLDTRVLFSRLEKVLETNEMSTIYLDAFKCMMNAGPKASGNLVKSSLFSENPTFDSFTSFFNSLNDKIISSKKIFIEAFQIDSNINLPDSLTTDRDIIKMMIMNSPQNIQKIDMASIESDREFLKELIDINPLILVHGYFEKLENDEELWTRAISKNPISMMGYYRDESYEESENFKQFLKETAVEHGYLLNRCDLESLFSNDRESIIKLLSKYGNAYQRIPTEFKTDREIAKTAITNCGFAYMYYFPAEFKDREMALLAVKENGSVFKSLTPELKQDPEIIALAGPYAVTKEEDDY